MINPKIMSVDFNRTYQSIGTCFIIIINDNHDTYRKQMLYRCLKKLFLCVYNAALKRDCNDINIGWIIKD